MNPGNNSPRGPLDILAKLLDLSVFPSFPMTKENYNSPIISSVLKRKE